MKLNINTKLFRNLVNTVAKCADTKTVTPILQSININFADNFLKLTASNLDQTAFVSTNIEGKENANICVDAKLLHQFINRISTENISLCLTTEKQKGGVEVDYLVIDYGNNQARFRTRDGDDFPDVFINFDHYGEYYTFHSNDLLQVFESALIGTQEDTTIKQMHHFSQVADLSIESTLIEPKFAFTSYDGKRLTFSKGLCEKSTEALDRSIQIPFQAIKTITPIIRNFINDYKNIRIMEDKNTLIIKLDKHLYFSFRKLTVGFPSLRKYIEAFQADCAYEVHANDLLESLNTVALFTDERTKRVTLDLNEDVAELSATNTANGTAAETVYISTNGKFKPTVLAYDSSLLLPVISKLRNELSMELQKDPRQNAYNTRITEKKEEKERNVEKDGYGVATQFFIQSLNVFDEKKEEVEEEKMEVVGV